MTLPLTNTGQMVADALPPTSSSRIADPCQRASVYGAIEDLPNPCMRLFEEAGRQSVFLTLPWFRNFAATVLAKNDQLRIYSISGKNTSEAAAAMFVAHSALRSNRLTSLRKLSSLTNYYSCFFAPHLGVLAGHAREPLRMLGRAIAAEKPHWDAVEIQPLDVNSEIYSALVEELKAAGFVVQTFFCFGNWYLPVNGRSFAQFTAALPAALKNTLTRKRKKLEKTGRAKIEIVTGGEGLEATIQAYTKVYLSSWKQPEPYPHFMPGLIRTCAAMGALRLGLVHVDGEPAAAQLWIVHGGTAMIYKLAYDERFADLSVGTILSAALFQHVLDVDRVHEVDYGSGDDAYKKDWMSHRRERWGILAMNPRTLRGNLSIARHVGGRAVKRAAISLACRFWRGNNQAGATSF